MIDANVTVNQVSNWEAGLSVKLPKPLSGLLATRDALTHVETGHEPVIDLDRLKPANVADEVEAVARELSVKEHRFEAKRRILNRLNRRILHEAGTAVPGIIGQLTPGFEAQAAKYTAAVAKLPRELNSDSIVRSGDPAILAAFGEATEAAKFIAKVDAWAGSLSQFPAYAGHEAEPALRVLTPDSYGHLRALLTAHNGAGTADPLVRQIGPLYFAAAHRSTKFQINTPVEAATLRAKLEASKPVTAVQKFHGNGRF
ncbi:hypothetical protein LCL87_14925 [Rhodococcus hoagii]|nr:hypothetical protein [Prescottella equi]